MMTNRKYTLLPLSLTAVLPLNAQTPADYMTKNTPGCRQDNTDIIYIMLDDAGYGDLLAENDLRLPHIDRMTDEGLLFTDHYAGAPVSAPSRCSLLTGRHTGHAYIRGNKEYRKEGQEALPLTETTVATVIKENTRYKTALFGKWGLGAPDSPGWKEGHGDPLRHGFDRFYGYLCQRQAHSYYPSYLWEGKDGQWTKDSLDNEYSHSLITEKALDFINECHETDQPYFLYLAYTIPHAMLQVPQKYVKEFYGDKHWAPLKKNFAAMMSLMDRDVGRILEAAGKENTIVFFTTDNGPHREGGANPKWFRSAGDFRGIKRQVYEGGIRVPLIVWGKNIRPGITDHPSAFWDFLPTVTDILGIEKAYPTDGISYAPTLFGTGNQKEHEYLYWEFHESDCKQAVRKGNMKLVRMKAHTEKPVFELYDLSSDKSEKRNLIKKDTETAAALMKIMQEAHTDSAVFPDIKPFALPDSEKR